MIEFSLFFRCKQGHEQKLDFGPGFSEDMVHDFGVLIAGGTLRSIDKPMPGFPCTTCGQPVGFSMVDRRKGRQDFLDRPQIPAVSFSPGTTSPGFTASSAV